MRNITFSADEELIERAERAAKARGTTLDDEARKWLGELSASAPASTESASKAHEAPNGRTMIEPRWQERDRGESETVRAARANRFLALMASLKHVDLGGPYTREELNER